ncbi:hypothetical protein B484DRAFT_462415, partial [Ochromonadaceae sp. CCMP2298]
PSRSRPRARAGLSTVAVLPAVAPGAAVTLYSPAAFASSSTQSQGTSTCCTSAKVTPIWPTPSLPPASPAPPTISHTSSWVVSPAACDILLLPLSLSQSWSQSSSSSLVGSCSSATSSRGSTNTALSASSADSTTVHLLLEWVPGIPDSNVIVASSSPAA